MAAALGVGCSTSPPAPPAQPAGRTGDRAPAPRAQLIAISGVVAVPTRLLAGRGGTILSDQGMRVVSGQGGRIVANGGALLRLLSPGERVGLAGARAYLADATGKRLPGLAEAFTDAAGRYEIENVPAGFAYLVVVEARTSSGRTAQLRGIAAPGQREVPVDLGTTLAAAAVVTPDRGIGSPDAVNLQALARQLEAKLGQTAPPDLTDAAAVAQAAQLLLAADASAQQQAEAARATTETAASPVPLAELVQAALAGGSETTPALKVGPSGSPDGSPVPAPSVSVASVPPQSSSPTTPPPPAPTGTQPPAPLPPPIPTPAGSQAPVQGPRTTRPPSSPAAACHAPRVSPSMPQAPCSWRTPAATAS